MLRLRNVLAERRAELAQDKRESNEPRGRTTYVKALKLVALREGARQRSKQVKLLESKRS